MTVFVVGAGLAGLAAAVRLAAAGQRVTLYEAARQAGGRCRSYHDKTLGRVIDNGNHLMLSGNHSLFAYLGEIGAEDGLVGPKGAQFPFVDLKTGKRWELRIEGDGWQRWFRDPMRAIPGADFSARLKALGLLFAGKNATVAASVGGKGPLWERFWEPMAMAVLNTPPAKASAWLLRETLRETFAKGEQACRPLMARDSLAASLIDPALEHLTEQRAEFYFGQRLRLIDLSRRAEVLHFANLQVPIEPDDRVILALPSWQVAELVPGVTTPEGAHAIVNVHFLLPKPPRRRGRSMILGLVGAEAHWIFLRDRVASVTVSAADALAEETADEIAIRLWTDVAMALDLEPDPLPPYRVIKEKRATFSQTPASLAKRPATRTQWRNVYLAGDWTDTGLPATIEGAVRSGHLAADAILHDLPPN